MEQENGNAATTRQLVADFGDLVLVWRVIGASKELNRKLEKSCMAEQAARIAASGSFAMIPSRLRRAGEAVANEHLLPDR